MKSEDQIDIPQLKEKDKFKLFFPNAYCTKIGFKQYAVYFRNYHCDNTTLMIASEGTTAHDAWSKAWWSLKQIIVRRLEIEYQNPWLELPNGIMFPGDDSLIWTWQELSTDPATLHFWIDIFQPELVVSMLDILM